MGRIESRLAELGEEHRMALILKEYEGMTYTEVAEVLEASPGTIKSWVYRGKRELYSILKRMGAV